MRPVVHPNRSRLFVRADVVLDRDHPLRLLVAFFPNMQIQGSTVDVGSHVNLALVLGQGETRRIPTEREHAGAFSNWQSEIIDQLRAGNALWEVFVKNGGPVARE